MASLSFPVALGGSTLSSEVLDATTWGQDDGNDDSDDNDDDNDGNNNDDDNEAAALGPQPSVAWAVCPHGEWQARVVSSFFWEPVAEAATTATTAETAETTTSTTEGGRGRSSRSSRSSREEENKDQDHDTTSDPKPRDGTSTGTVWAEIRVQISHLARPLSPIYRETVHRLRLQPGRLNSGGGAVNDDNDEDQMVGGHESPPPGAAKNQAQQTQPRIQQRRRRRQRQPEVVFSQDRRSLAVLLFPPFPPLSSSGPVRRNNDAPNDGSYAGRTMTSRLVLFQLRRPRTDAAAGPPSAASAASASQTPPLPGIPLPSYVMDHSNSNTGANSTYGTYGAAVGGNRDGRPLAAASGDHDGLRRPATTSSSSVNASTNTAAFSVSTATPAVATNPRTFAAINGTTTTTIDAICRVPGATAPSSAGESNNSSSSNGSSSSRQPVLLAACRGGTLVWIDARSAVALAMAVVLELGPSPPSPSPSSSPPSSPMSLSPPGATYRRVTSMQAGPGSTLERGTLAMVVVGESATSTSTATASESEVHDGGGGECLLVKWSSLLQAGGEKKDDGDDNDHGLQSAEKGGRGNGAVDDDDTRTVRVDVLSRWSGRGGDGDNNYPEHGPPQPPSPQPPSPDRNHRRRPRRHHHPRVVVDARFGTMPSVLCVLYRAAAPPSQLLPSPTAPSERRQRIAQVLTVTEAGTLVPIVSLFLTLEQLEHASSVNAAWGGGSNRDRGRDDGDECYMEELKDWSDTSSFFRSTQSQFGLEHDGASDNFIISAIFGRNDYWTGCVWNWRANAIGWMIQQKLSSSLRDSLLWSKLYYGRDPFRGAHLVYVEASYQEFANSEPSRRRMEIRKQGVACGSLSPSNSLVPGLSEPCGLLLASDYVSFPWSYRKGTCTDTLQLGWRTSALPQSYVTAYGAPQIAAIGLEYAKSVAIASRNGVCVLDTSHQHRHRWKQFGSPNEERAFSVAAMTWWEGRPDGKSEDWRDDLLLAIVETSDGRQYLSCWSPKRFDLAHQLLDNPDPEWKDGESQDPAPSWGIALPTDMVATNISLLTEPKSRFLGGGNPRRAVVLVYAADPKTSEFDYVVFRMQVFPNKGTTAQSAQQETLRPFYVMTQEGLRGTLKNGTRSVGPVSGIFLASAWFRYDLRTTGKTSSKGKKPWNDDFVVTLGVVRTPGVIEGVCLGCHDNAWFAPIVKSEVSRYWLTDIIQANDLLKLDGPPIVTFVWAIELLNGDLFCWSVPSVVTCSSGQMDDWHMSASFKQATIDRPKGLRLASLVCKSKKRDEKKRWLLGSICDLGSASDWVQQASQGSQLDIALGCVPDSSFGCILRSGQGCKQFMRTPIDSVDEDSFSSSLHKTEVFCQSPFLMTPPAFVISLHILLLEAASLRTEIPILEASNLTSTSSLLEAHLHRLKVIENHVHRRLTTAPNKDAVMMALRLLVLRSVELLARAHKRHSKDQSDVSESNLLLGMMFFSVIVDAVRRCTTNLQFASLVLEVGRQIEPGNLEHLYPLPLPAAAAVASAAGPEPSDAALDRTTARTVVDLFALCIDEGSVAASASALPLMTSRAQARRYCVLLLDEAIDSFVRNTHHAECDFDTTEEERRVIGDIFSFGMKLEDAELWEENEADRGARGRGEYPAEGSADTIDLTTDTGSTMTDDSDPAEVGRTFGGNLVCGSGGTGTILNYIVPSSIRGGVTEKKQEEVEEDAIRREASAFIRSSLDDPTLGFSSLPDWDGVGINPILPDAAAARVGDGDDDINSVAGIVGDALLDLLQPTRTDNNWRAMAAMARLLLRGSRPPSSSSYGLASRVAKRARPIDVMSILPESYDADVGAASCGPNLVLYLRSEIAQCAAQVGGGGPSSGGTADAALIVDVALLVLDRIVALPLPDAGDQAVMEVGLVFIVLVAGHVCGRSDAILDGMDDGNCLLAVSYDEAVRDGD